MTLKPFHFLEAQDIYLVKANRIWAGREHLKRLVKLEAGKLAFVASL